MLNRELGTKKAENRKVVGNHSLREEKSSNGFIEAVHQW